MLLYVIQSIVLSLQAIDFLFASSIQEGCLLSLFDWRYDDEEGEGGGNAFFWYLTSRSSLMSPGETGNSDISVKSGIFS